MEGKLTAVMEEAMVSKPSVPYIYTLEIIHPDVKTGTTVTPIRIVKNTVDINAPLESTAPYNPNTTVLFKALNFDITFPPESAKESSPEIDLQIDNVTLQLKKYLDIAVQSSKETLVILRPYLLNNLAAGVQMESPPRLVLSSVTATTTSVSGKCRLQVIGDRDFLTVQYLLSTFPSLFVGD